MLLRITITTTRNNKFIINIFPMNYKNNISKAAMKEIKMIITKVNKEEQIQSKIHDNINFYKNTINLLIGRRGLGKIFNVGNEMVKLGCIPNFGGYTYFIIISDKDNDSTINEMLKLIKLKVIHINYDQVLKTFGDII
jgi:hypothetical protein